MISEKNKFYFSNVNGRGPRSRNDIDFQYSHVIINSITCLHLPTFRPQAAITVPENPLFSLIPIEKPKLPNFTCRKIGQGHSRSSFEQTKMDRSLRCYISSFVEIGPPVPEKIFEGFLPYTCIGVAAILVM